MEQLNGDFISLRMDELGLRQIDLANSMNCDKSKIYTWQRNKAKPTGDQYRLLLKVLKLGVDSNGDIFRIENTLNFIKLKEIKVLSYVQAGQLTTINQNDYIEKITLPIELIDDADFALKVEGDSMYNPNDSRSLVNGDYVVVSTKRKPEFGDIVVVLSDGTYSTIKIYAGDANHIYLKALNPEYANISEFNYTGNECKVVGVVTSSAPQPKVYHNFKKS